MQTFVLPCLSTIQALIAIGDSKVISLEYLRYDLLDIRLIFVSFSWNLTSFSNWHWKPSIILNLGKSHFLCPSCLFIASLTKIQHVWSNCSSFFSSFAILYSDDYLSFIPRGQNGKRMDVLNKGKMEENTFECPWMDFFTWSCYIPTRCFDILMLWSSWLDNSFGETYKMPLFSID